MRCNVTRLACFAITCVVLGILASPRARAQVTIDFETNPALPTQPNNFAAAGPMQTYTQPGLYSISGGVVLGNPTFLASFAAQGSSPNLYGTADFADPSLQQTITLDMPFSAGVVSVTGVLFNGQSTTESYTVEAFSGGTLVDSAAFASIPADTNPNGFADFSLSSAAALPITEVRITTPNTGVNGWDFFVDTLRLTQKSTTAVPEPGALALLVGVVIPVGFIVRRRR